MSILIAGMEMPKAEFGSMIFAIRPDGMVEDVMGCYVGKAVPVPPHGRLIDADALWDHVELLLKYTTPDSLSAMKARSMMVDLETAPTIIPASKDG